MKIFKKFSQIYDKDDLKILEAENLLHKIEKNIIEKGTAVPKKEAKIIPPQNKPATIEPKIEMINPNIKEQEFLQAEDIEEFKRYKVQFP